MKNTAGPGALGMNVDKLLGEAIAAESAGDRGKALDLLEILVEVQPQHEEAWMWIAKLADSPAKKISTLEIILNLNPDNTAARQYLETLRQRRQRVAQDFVARAEEQYQRGEQALKAKDYIEATRCFWQAVQLNPNHLLAWQQLGEGSIQIPEKVEAYRNLVRLRPEDEKARQTLKQLARIQKSPLETGHYYDQHKFPLLATDAYQQALSISSSPATKLEAERLLEDARIRHHIPSYRGVSPAFTLVRLSLGPIIFYALLVFIQAGLNPLQVSPVLCPSGMLVAIGSVLLAALHEKATRTLWLRVYGEQHSEKYIAAGLAALGFALLLLPFLFVLFDSLLRLRALEL